MRDWDINEGLPGVPGLGNKGTKERIEGNKGTVNLFYGKGKRKLYKLEDENILI